MSKVEKMVLSILTINDFISQVSRVILIGEFFPIFFTTFFSRSFSIFHICLFCFPDIGMLANLIYLVLENFTNSDRTPPPYIDTYLQLFPNLGNYGKNALRFEARLESTNFLKPFWVSTVSLRTVLTPSRLYLIIVCTYC